MPTDAAPQTANNPLPWNALALRLLLTLALPPLLALTSVRLVMTELFVQIEYQRPGFPADRYGFSRAERLHYAPYAVRYLHNDAGISYLGDLTFPDGSALFNARELQHMADVKAVTRVAFQVHRALLVAAGVSALLLARRRVARRALWRALADGGLITIVLIVVLGVLIVASWDLFFDSFHALFFEGDTWVFRTSDTLIRLFPEQFWFDAALTVAALTVSGSLLAMLIGWRMERRMDGTQSEAGRDLAIPPR
ncbi:MAG: TIGR01906 family membrane protein [Anaerolineae bacterium]|nr:TIGR01906 family membrane protein [Anaerolineae bacterium]